MVYMMALTPSTVLDPKPCIFPFFLNQSILIYTVMLISTLQPSDVVIHIYVLFYILLHCGLSQDIKYSSLHFSY